jgi:hypothetical protein
LLLAVPAKRRQWLSLLFSAVQPEASYFNAIAVGGIYNVASGAASSVFGATAKRPR